MIGALFSNLLRLYLEAAPWLLLGLAAAGVIKAWVPEGRVGRWLGGRGPWPVVKAALVGAPLPLCSCGVLPAALGLRRAGASRGATLSFLIATPETGLDSLAVSYALLGPFLAVLRPFAAVGSAMVTGLLTVLLPAEPQRPLFQVIAAPAGCGCSGECAVAAVPAVPTTWSRTVRGLRYALTDILDDITLWLAIGLLLAAAVATWVPPLAMTQWGGGLPAMLAMLLLGVPMYICATASTPLAAGLLLAGVSPGAALVFLLTGPATNIATMAVVRREMGGMVLALYLAGVALTAVAFGLATDALAHHFAIDVQRQLGAAQTLVPSGLAWCSGLLLLLCAVKPLRRLWLR